MENKPLIISYFTEEYKQRAEELIKSCDALGLEYDITEIKDLGSWYKNCSYKAEFILSKLDEHKRSVIWTDVDSVIVSLPKILLECRADCALRVNDMVAVDDVEKILSSTMFFNSTPSAVKLLTLWQKECERQLQKDPTALDKVCLRKVVLHYPTIVEMKRIPASYLRVEEDKNLQSDDVIVYHQVLREMCQV